MRPHILLSILLLTGACASGQSATGQRVDRNVITRDQIQQNGYRNAYDAVQALRAPWLVARPDGLTVQREVLVYLDNTRMGGVETLRQITAAQIIRINWIDPGTAVNRWGVDHSQGVIMVITR
jgi:hypothetical protein